MTSSWEEEQDTVTKNSLAEWFWECIALVGRDSNNNICQQEHLERKFYSFEQKRHLSHIKQVRLYLPPAALRTVDVFSGLEITNLWEWEKSSFWFRSGLVSVCLQLLDKKKQICQTTASVFDAILWCKNVFKTLVVFHQLLTEEEQERATWWEKA